MSFICELSAFWTDLYKDSHGICHYTAISLSGDGKNWFNTQTEASHPAGGGGCFAPLIQHLHVFHQDLNRFGCHPLVLRHPDHLCVCEEAAVQHASVFCSIVTL